MKRKYIIAGICAVLVIALAVFIWTELQKEPLDLKMYGAEISADGTVIQETEFSINGYLKDNANRDDFMRPYNIYFKPITFKDISDFKISMEYAIRTEMPVLLHGDANNPNYCAFVDVYFQSKDSFELVKLYLCHEMCCCVIDADGRYFVGSVEPDTPVADILGHFLGLDLQAKN